MTIVDAIKTGDLAQVRKILDHNETAVTNNSPIALLLHYAAWYNHPDIIDELVRRGADVNAKDPEGRTPLHLATFHDHPDAVRRLIHHKADPNHVDNYGFTPLVYAIRERTSNGNENYHLLILAGANYDIHAAVSKPDIARVREILGNDSMAMKSVVDADQVLIDALIGLEADVSTNAKEMLDLLFGNGLEVDRSLIADLAAEYGGTISDLLNSYLNK